MPVACLIMASNRVHGNSAFALDLIKTQLRFKYELQEFTLPNLTLKPCLACGHCELEPGTCVQDGLDDCQTVLDHILRAELLVVCSPVYFYGPPAKLKALIDRAQKFWALKKTIEVFKPALAVFCAARMQGEHLFTANTLILNCFLQCLGFKMSVPLGLKELDTAKDLINKPEAQREITSYAIEIIGKIS